MSEPSSNNQTVKKRTTRNSNKTTIDDISNDHNNKEIYYDNSQPLDEVTAQIAYKETVTNKRTKNYENTDEDILPISEPTLTTQTDTNIPNIETTSKPLYNEDTPKTPTLKALNETSPTTSTSPNNTTATTNPNKSHDPQEKKMDNDQHVSNPNTNYTILDEDQLSSDHELDNQHGVQYFSTFIIPDRTDYMFVNGLQKGIAEILQHIKSITGISNIRYKNQIPYIVVSTTQQQDMLSFIDKQLQDFPYIFKHLNAHNFQIESEKYKEKILQRTVKLTNVPQDMPPQIIVNTFSKYGEIEQLYEKTRPPYTKNYNSQYIRRKDASKIVTLIFTKQASAELLWKQNEWCERSEEHTSELQS